MSPKALIGPLPARIVEVTGADRATYLEAVTSQHLTDLDVGEVRGAMTLDAHGAPQSIFDVAAVDEDTWLLAVPDGELAEEVVRTLGGRTFLADARFTLLDHVVDAVRGADAHEVAAQAGYRAATGAVTQQGDVLVLGREHGVDLVGPAAAVERARSAVEGAGGVVSDPERLRAADLAAGRPGWGSEVAPPHLPEELGLLPTHVHLAKGCYPGQEAVARMWMLGRPRRRLAVLDVEGSVGDGWEHGARRDRVQVTRVAVLDDHTVALGFVPADAAPGDRFGDDDGSVTVREIVGASQAVPGHDPAMTRRRDKRG